MSKDDSLLTTELLQHRLNAGLGIAGGSRGSLTKCAALALAGSAEAAGHELQLQQLEMMKLVLTVERNQQEIEQLKNQPTASADSKTVTELRNELDLVQRVKSCLEEYEALAKLTVHSHAVSEHHLQSELKSIQEKHEKAVEDLQKAEAECRIRQGQFHLLQQCLQDLKQSLSQPLELQPHELEQAVDKVDKMDVDEEPKNDDSDDDDDDEEEGLYEDL